MKKNLLLYVLLIFLIAVNGFFLYNYLGNENKQKPKGPPGAGTFIVKALEFNDEQLVLFKELDKKHHMRMRRISEQIRMVKDDLFNRLSNDEENRSAIDSLTSLIAENTKAKEQEVFYHLKEVQEICNEKQKAKFKEIIKDALRKGGMGNEHPPRPGEGIHPRPGERPGQGPDEDHGPPPH